MLKSKFSSKNRDEFRATKIFTDRNKPRDVFSKIKENYKSSKEYKKILVYYGFGGIGKTALLKKLYKNTKDEFRSSFVSLDVYSYNNPVDILLKIRKDLNVKCDLFDYALIQYFTKINLTSKESLERSQGINNEMFEMLSNFISAGTGDMTITTVVLNKIVQKVFNKYLSGKYKEEINSIDGYTEFELYQRLPYYLGLDIEKSGRKIICFMDAYESMLKKLNSSAIREDSEEWLKEFFLSSPQIVLVIASREKLKWEQKDSEWNKYFDQHILKILSPKDGEYFLKNIPINDDKIIKKILDISKGVPLFLDMCVDLYEDKLNENEAVDSDFFNISTNQIIDRYLRHYSQDIRFLIRVLSNFNQFDRELIDHFVKKYSLGINHEEIIYFSEKSLIIHLDEKLNLLKVDESVRDHIKLNNNIHLDKLSKYLLDYLISHNQCSKQYIYYFYELMNILCENSLELDFRKLIKVINSLFEKGYWIEVNDIITDNSERIPNQIQLYSNIRYLRRVGKLEKAKKIIDKNADEIGKMNSDYKFYFMYLKVQIYHLLGHYNFAISQYKKLIQKFDILKGIVDVKTEAIVNIKFADVLMLKGQFELSLERLEYIQKNIKLENSLLIEVLRVKGHIYRFNLMDKEADEIYNEILKNLIQEDDLSSRGKIYTNLAETWSYTNPNLALKYAEESIEINTKINSMIELGKVYCAKAIALSNINKIEEALFNVNKALNIQNKNGYKSGILFCEIAYVYIFKRSNLDYGEKIITEHLYKVKNIISEIDVYEYLYININNYDVITNKIKWLDVSELEKKIKLRNTK